MAVNTQQSWQKHISFLSGKANNKRIFTVSDERQTAIVPNPMATAQNSQATWQNEDYLDYLH